MHFSRRRFLQISGAAALVPTCARLFASTDPATQALCHRLAADPLRPQYHLLPAHNWMNDPNGPIFYKGQYHMFHQYNPESAVWGNMNWAHATSPDMIHWQHQPIALSPTPGGYDRNGVFSGSAVLDHGKPVVIYTGVLPASSPSDATLNDGVHVWREVQMLATAGDDDLRSWTKLPDPIISAPPTDLKVTGFRDPYVWREGDQWLLILGSGFKGKGGAILLYSSSDLRHWNYLHPLVEGPGNGTQSANPVDIGEMWECPDFFPIGNKHVLLISTMGKVRWKVGTYANQRFTPEKEGVLDWGSYYAAKTMLDKDGNRVLWGWISESRPDQDLLAAGWAGAMSLPRVMSLNTQNELRTELHSSAQMLRGQHSGIKTNEATSALREKVAALGIRDLAAELKVTIQPKSGEFKLRLHSDSGDFVALTVAGAAGDQHLQVGPVTAPLAAAAGSPLTLHMLVDGSVIEVFVENGPTLTARIYQVPSGPLRLRLEGNAEIKSLDLWQMKPISKDRLTGSLCS